MISRADLDHNNLVCRAEHWLRKRGCGVVLRDPFFALTVNNERPDAIGWRAQVSILIECKVSRADFLADQAKACRRDETGMGDWRFYLCPAGLIEVEDLPEDWGLLYTNGRGVEEVYGVPGNALWSQSPFQGNKTAELDMMYSALRRLNQDEFYP